MEWSFKKFEALTPHEVYAILRLRNEVFVVEQQCIFQDADDKDPFCHHLMGWENGALLAYTRIVPAGLAYPEASIGRVVTSPSARGRGAGKKLMQQSLRELYTLYGPVSVRIGAQLYLLEFYHSLGFREEGSVYLEDGIDHIEMVKSE